MSTQNESKKKSAIKIYFLVYYTSNLYIFLSVLQKLYSKIVVILSQISSITSTKIIKLPYTTPEFRTLLSQHIMPSAGVHLSDIYVWRMKPT